MKFKYLLELLILCTAGVLVYSGCSASSNSARYKEKSESPKEKSPSVRFTSEDDINESNIFEDENIPVEESIDISSVITKDKFSGNSEFSTVREKMLMEILKYINTPYQYGGNSKTGIDCSAFTQSVFRNSTSIYLLRTAKDQYNEGSPVTNPIDLKFGDLVFFDTRSSIKPGHVGIFLGENLFAHASSRQGVIVSSLESEYYSKRFMGGRRIEELYGSN